jgi:AraC family transcriptional regulator
LIKRINKNPKIGYELHLEPEEYNETGKYYILVGIEVLETLDIPLEMFLKILPKTNYIHFTTKVKNANLEVQKVYEDWIPDNGFEEVYPYMIESYHSDRYKGLDNLESQIDWYIPVKKEAS